MRDCCDPLLCVAALLLSLGNTPSVAQSIDGYIGSIWLFGGGYCPRSTLPADGRLLSIQSYQSLYALFGARYGGDSVTNFALPDLRDAVPVDPGTNFKTMIYCVNVQGNWPVRD